MKLRLERDEFRRKDLTSNNTTLLDVRSELFSSLIPYWKFIYDDASNGNEIYYSTGNVWQKIVER